MSKETKPKITISADGRDMKISMLEAQVVCLKAEVSICRVDLRETDGVVERTQDALTESMRKLKTAEEAQRALAERLCEVLQVRDGLILSNKDLRSLLGAIVDHAGSDLPGARSELGCRIRKELKGE